MFRTIVLLVGAMASLWAVSLSAQDAILGQKYGYGVHAYFSGDYLKAHDQLTAAIDGGSKDPRAFYFRGLSYLRLGRPQEALQDFQSGAALESRDLNRFYNVSKALERVQGPARVELENYRVEARMIVLEEAERARKARYEAIEREEARVLREQPLVPPEPVEAPEPAAEQEAEPAADDPFAKPEEQPAAKAVKKPAQKPVAEPADEAAAEKEPAEAPAGDDPFAAPAAEEAEPAVPADASEKPADVEEEPADAEKEPAEDEEPAEKPAEKKGGLMGAMGKALGKAMGGKAEKAPATETKEEPADAANPFMEEAADAEEEPADAEEEPAAEKKEPADAEEEPAAEEDAPEEKPAKPKKSAAKKPTGDDADPFAQ